MTARTVAATTAAFLALGILTGCSGDDPEPRFAPTSPAPTSPSTTGVAEPTMPAAARQHDAAGAEAFVRYYWEMVNYAQATGDVEGLDVLSLRCINCDNGVEFIESAYKNGGKIRGGQATPRDLVARSIDHDGHRWMVVECTISLTKQVVDAPGTKDDKRYQGGDTAVRFYLEPTSPGWTIRTLDEQ